MDLRAGWGLRVPDRTEHAIPGGAPAGLPVGRRALRPLSDPGVSLTPSLIKKAMRSYGQRTALSGLLQSGQDISRGGRWLQPGQAVLLAFNHLLHPRRQMAIAEKDRASQV